MNDANYDFKFIDLFAGIGGFRIAFEANGGKCVFSSEINKFARHTYSANYFEVPIPWYKEELYKEHPELYGDIRKIDANEIYDFDILAAGFPCPSFSIAGVSKRNSLGMKHGLEDEDKGQLFFQITRILEAKRPVAFLLENVKNLKNHNKGRTYKFMKEQLEEIGYNVTEAIFDAAKLVPQHRERIFIAGTKKDLKVNFDFKEVNIPDINPKLDSILTPNNEVNEKYTISDRLWEYLQAYKKKHRSKGNGFGYSLVTPMDIARTMSARYHKDGSEILIDQTDIGKNNPRMLTEWESARLFGYPEEYERVYNKKFQIPVSRTQAYRQFGNSLCVPLVRILAENLINSLKATNIFGQKKINNKEKEAS